MIQIEEEILTKLLIGEYKYKVLDMEEVYDFMASYKGLTLKDVEEKEQADAEILIKMIFNE